MDFKNDRNSIEDVSAEIARSVQSAADADAGTAPAAAGSKASADKDGQDASGEAQKKRGFPVKRIIAAILLLVLAALVIYRIFGKHKTIETNPLAVVSVGHAEYGDIAIETSLIGKVDPADVYHVVPKAAGEITQIFVAVGDEVKEGDPICTIDNSKAVDAAAIQLDAAKVTLRSSEEAFALAATNLQRMTALLEAGDISRQTFESTKNGYDQAAAAVEGARLSLDGAQLSYNTQVEFSTVTAPASGTVQSVSMSINGMASQASPVCVISSRGNSKITFNISDRLLGAFAPGTPITVTRQGSEYAAKVTSVSNLPGVSGLYPVEAVFLKEAGIPGGSTVKLSFISEKSENVLLVDTDDITHDGGKTYVFTLSYNNGAAGTGSGAAEGTADAAANSQSTIGEGNTAGTVHKVEVTTGLSDRDKTEITGGIDADSLLILSWTAQLYEGALVQVLPEG